MTWAELCRLADLPDPGSRGFEVDGIEGFVYATTASYAPTATAVRTPAYRWPGRRTSTWTATTS